MKRASDDRDRKCHDRRRKVDTYLPYIMSLLEDSINLPPIYSYDVACVFFFACTDTKADGRGTMKN